MGKLSQWVKECIEGCRTRGELNSSNNGQVLIEKFSQRMDEGYEGNVTVPKGGKLIVQEGADVEGLSTGGGQKEDFIITLSSNNVVTFPKTYNQLLSEYGENILTNINVLIKKNNAIFKPFKVSNTGDRLMINFFDVVNASGTKKIHYYYFAVFGGNTSDNCSNETIG